MAGRTHPSQPAGRLRVCLAAVQQPSSRSARQAHLGGGAASSALRITATKNRHQPRMPPRFLARQFAIRKSGLLRPGVLCAETAALHVASCVSRRQIEKRAPLVSVDRRTNTHHRQPAPTPRSRRGVPALRPGARRVGGQGGAGTSRTAARAGAAGAGAEQDVGPALLAHATQVYAGQRMAQGAGKWSRACFLLECAFDPTQRKHAHDLRHPQPRVHLCGVG